jgi:hypothetical protein
MPQCCLNSPEDKASVRLTADCRRLRPSCPPFDALSWGAYHRTCTKELFRNLHQVKHMSYTHLFRAQRDPSPLSSEPLAHQHDMFRLCSNVCFRLGQQCSVDHQYIETVVFNQCTVVSSLSIIRQRNAKENPVVYWSKCTIEICRYPT